MRKTMSPACRRGQLKTGLLRPNRNWLLYPLAHYLDSLQLVKRPMRNVIVTEYLLNITSLSNA